MGRMTQRVSGEMAASSIAGRNGEPLLKGIEAERVVILDIDHRPTKPRHPSTDGQSLPRRRPKSNF